MVNAPPVKNLVCAPPSETPGKVNIELLMISALYSALNCGSGCRNSAFRSVASARSTITSTGCLPSSAPICPSDLPTYFSNSGLFSTH